MKSLIKMTLSYFFLPFLTFVVLLGVGSDFFVSGQQYFYIITLAVSVFLLFFMIPSILRLKRGDKKLILFGRIFIIFLWILWLPFGHLWAIFLGEGINPPRKIHDIKHEESGGRVIIYEQSCFIPDGQYECDYYNNLIYFKKGASFLFRKIRESSNPVDSVSLRENHLHIIIDGVDGFTIDMYSGVIKAY